METGFQLPDEDTSLPLRDRKSRAQDAEKIRQDFIKSKKPLDENQGSDKPESETPGS